jgi:hypothetical protein
MISDAPAPPREGHVAGFRERYREAEIGPAYRGWLHFAFTSLSCIGVVVFCLARLQHVTPLEWLTVPAVFLYANLVEYLGHRGPMHHPVRGLGLLFRRHTLQHHRFFTDDAMSFESSRDFKAVLFPPVMILFFIGGFGVPMWLILHYLASANVAWLGVATGMAYYLNYEWLHFAYHCDPDSRIGRIPGLQALRRLHLRHHDPQMMSRFNFNITYPVGDWLFGTLRRGQGARKSV